MAIHKSVACFVDKEYRSKAKPWNCYTRKSGLFLPQYADFITPNFKKEPKDKITYFEYTDEFLSSTEALSNYIHHILGSIKLF
jgi:hypothetical protein